MQIVHSRLTLVSPCAGIPPVHHRGAERALAPRLEGRGLRAVRAGAAAALRVRAVQGRGHHPRHLGPGEAGPERDRQEGGAPDEGRALRLGGRPGIR